MKKSLLFLISVVLMPSAAWAEEAEFTYNENGARDPFWPLVTAGGALVNYDKTFTVSEMTLEGIIEDVRGGLAIINGAVVEEGRSVSGYIVKKITPRSVVLEKDGQATELRLKKEE